MKNKKSISILSVILLMIPFIQNLFTGITAIAATKTALESIALIHNDYGATTLRYEVNTAEKEIDWQYTVTKTAQTTPTQFGMKLVSAGETVPIQALQIEDGNYEVKDGWLTQKQPTFEALTKQVVHFKTKLVEEVNISSAIWQKNDQGEQVDLLADQNPVKVVISSANVQTSSKSTTETTKELITEESKTTATSEKQEETTDASKSPESPKTRVSEDKREQEGETGSSELADSVAPASEVIAKAEGRDITELPGAEALSDSEEGKTIFSEAELTKDGQPIDGMDIQVDDNLLLQYEWSLPEELRKHIQAGDYFDFKLPDKFVINAEQLTGSLTDSEGRVYGTFVINKDGSVRITFTDEVEKNSGIKGKLNVAGKVDRNKIDGPGDTEIDVPFVDGSDHETPNIVVPNTKAISKKVVSQSKNDEIIDNKATVRWEIIANQTANTMTNGQLTDYLPKGATYKGNLTVMEYDVDLATGKLIEPGKAITLTPSFDSDGNPVFKFPSPTKKAYKVSFDTAIDLDQYESAVNPEDLSATVTNKANLTSEETKEVDASASATFGSSSVIKKSGTGIKDGVASWQITFTKSGIDIPGGTTFIDKIGQGQIMTDQNGRELSVSELQDILQAEFTKNGKNAGKTIKVSKNSDGSYRLEFPEGIADSFDLTLFTSAKGDAHQYTNSISWNGNDSHGENNVEQPKSGIVKENDKGQNAGGVISSDKNDGIVNWTIKINSEHATLDKWQLTDKLKNSTWSKKPTDVHLFEIVKGVEKEVDPATYTLTEITDTGFTLAYDKKTASEFVIRFQSIYDKNKWDLNVSNDAAYNFTQGDKTWSSGDDSSFKTPGDQRAQVQGSKGGEFNAINNTVTWRIKLNTSHIPLGDQAKLTDPIPAGQTYNGDGKVYKEDGQTQATGFSVLEEAGKIVVTGFPKGSTAAYEFVFTTTVATENGEIAVGSAKNTATYQDDLNKKLQVSASVDYTKNADYVSKTDNYDSKQDLSTVHYAIEVNPGKLTLKNVKLVDSKWVNVKVIPSTLKISDSEGNDVTDKFKTTFAEQQFEIDFGNISEHYRVTYDSKINFVGNPGENVPVKNTATITGDNIDKESGSDSEELVVKVPDAGGTAQGEVRSLLIKKVDQDSGEAISDAVLALYRGPVSDGKLVATCQTDEKGEATFDNLTFDDYTLIEETPANGYYISDELKKGIVVTIDESSDPKAGQMMKVVNQRLGSLHLTKVAAEDTNKVLANATFKLYYADATTQVTTDGLGQAVGEGEAHTFTTDAEGTLLITNLIPGKYLLKEISAPDGYHWTEVDTQSTVAPGETTEITIENQLNKGRIQLQKVDQDGHNLAGASFTLSDGNPKNDVIKTSGQDGMVSFDLEANKVYTITETTNPTGYSGSFKLENIRVVADGKVVYGEPAVEYSPANPLKVTNNLLTLDIKGEKTWALSGNDAALVLPASLKVTLLQNDTVYKEVITTAAENWKYSFTDLPKVNQKDGKDYVYKVIDKVDGYTTKYGDNPYDLINQLETTSLSGEKTWDPLAETFDVIPDAVTIQLLYSEDQGASWQPFFRDGQELSYSATATEGWKYHFDNLPKYNGSGDSLTYKVQEIDVPGFTPESKDGQNLYNKMETTSIAINKYWSDSDNYYGTRPSALDFTLMVKEGGKWKSFAEVFHSDKTIHLKGSSTTWKGTFKELPKYDKSGNLIQYGVKENLSGLTNVYIPNGGKQGDSQQLEEAAQGATSLFTNNLATVSITVKKSWSDFDNRFDSRPDRIAFQLYAWHEGESEAMAKAFGTPTNHSGIFDIAGPNFEPLTIVGLPEYDQEGNKMHYKVEEVNIQENYSQTPGYETDGSDLTIVNELLTTDITINKQWDDKGNSSSNRPEITLALYRNIEGEKPALMTDNLGTDYTRKIPAGSTAENWQVTFENLPRKDKLGHDYIYSVKELTTTNNYQQDQLSALTVKNSLLVTDVPVIKQWQDNGNDFGSRPQSIEFSLYYKVGTAEEKPFLNEKGEPVKKVIDESTAISDSQWQYTFTNLPKFDIQGTEYEYLVHETRTDESGQEIMPNYAGQESGTVMVNRLVTTEVTGEKTWQDEENRFASRPESIYVQLYQNGKSLGTDYLQEVSKGQNGGWKYRFTDLPKMDDAGKEYSYSVKEVNPPKNYQVSADGMSLINTLVTTEISGEKTWKDQQDVDGLRPTKITVALLQNNKIIQRTEASEISGWRYSFGKLPTYDQNGQKYQYTVIEESIPNGYQATVDGFNITNTHTPAGKKGRLTLPKTGEANSNWLLLTGIILVSLAICLKMVKRKKNSQ